MPGGRTCAALEELVEFSAVGMTPVMVDLPEIVAPAPPLAWSREAAALLESIRERGGRTARLAMRWPMTCWRAARRRRPPKPAAKRPAPSLVHRRATPRCYCPGGQPRRLRNGGARTRL